jgi:hypothetical protein
MSSEGGDTNARDGFSELLKIARGIQKGLQDLGTLVEQSGSSPATAHSDTEVAPVGAGFASASAPVAETEVKEPTPPSTATGSVVADFLWPDGCMVFEVPWGQVRHGVAHFGWMFACNNTKKLRGGARRRYYYCLGVFTCQSCNFVARPKLPLKVKIGAAAKLPLHVCPRHPDAPLLWIPCNGGTDACKLVLDIAPTGTIEAAHSGLHDHPHPPTSKPSPASLRLLADIVKTNPRAGPAKLRMGVDGRPSLADVDEAFYNQDRVGYYRRKEKRTAPTKAHGIRNSVASLFEFVRDVPQNFFLQVSIDPKDANFTMQTPHMRRVLLEASSGLQSDTVEGVIHDHDYSGKIDIQFTSGYDCVLRRWVPVLISVIFGRTKKHFAAHWKWLFESYGCQDDWQQFTTLFPGLTLDWSDAEGESFLDKLVSFAKG